MAPAFGSLTLDVLGAGPAWSDRPGSSGASYLVRLDDTAVLLDLGQGSFPRLAATTDPAALDAVLISHLHPDHFIDLVPLRHFLAYQMDPPGRMRVIAPAGLSDRIDALHDQRGFTATTLDCEPFPVGAFEIGELTAEARRVTHTDNSHAIRVGPADGPGLVYSGDCGVASDLVPLIRPGDALLVEVSFGARPVPPGSNHLNAAAIAGLVRTATPARVLLTHLQMGLDGDAAIAVIRQAFDGPVDLVEPGQQFKLDRT